MVMTTTEIRTAFLEFFKSKGHQIVSSSSLVPNNDPTLLFTNAGMNQFKDVFLGKEKRSYTRATTAQKCVRAGGKHNDLDNVGYTARHHTFFEMLGNFSFGDYFKKEVIPFAWEFLTEVIKLPKDRLTVTVYADDDEAYDIWHDVVGLPAERIIRIGDNKGAKYASDNFWQMGDTGPCGPSTEIFYDHGADIWGGPPGSPEEDGDRYIEIWNLVFMQFNRLADGTMEKLPKPSVDTGMGLERIAAVLQGVHNNYDIDLFKDLISYIADLLKVSDLTSKSLRVIADHIRSCSFLIADGVMPSNEGRGYVLRRIIRRAVRHGRLLGVKDVFFYKIVSKLVELMGAAYPELVQQQPVIEKVLHVEEEQFAKTIDRGLALLEDALKNLNDTKVIPGNIVFKLYDTYGFPADLTADVVRDRGYTTDNAGFDELMQKQKALAKENSNFKVDYNKQLSCKFSSEFKGYESVETDSKILEIFKNGKDSVSSVSAGDDALIILDQTPFYGEKGGQIGDVGVIETTEGRFIVTDTQLLGNAVAHVGYTEQGCFEVGKTVKARIDVTNRAQICAHHSATHLLQAALQQVLGSHVAQKGSFVCANRLRFDFSHFEAVTAEQLQQVEKLVNDQIRANSEIKTQLMTLEDAKKTCAMALFNDKYDDTVRVVSMGDFSMELCGGTHAKRTGDLGLFKIDSESGISAGVRRIEALVGSAAVAEIQEQSSQLSAVNRLIKGEGSVSEKVSALIDEQKALEKQISALKEKIAVNMAASLLNDVVTINNTKVLVAELNDVEAKNLRNILDDLKSRLGSGVIVLATKVNEEKVSLIAGVTSNLTSKIKAGELINMVASFVGGKGGGRPDMAQAGGTKPEFLDKALSNVHSWLEERL
ncbi:MAG: alanine--tRNA ligase [Succinivibrionaceae bacterium]|nr:alanine--tRNA ligase [Succinivibrionaceae bacterium]